MEALTTRGRDGPITLPALPQTVVVPLDGTDASRSALPLAYLLAGTFEAPLHRVHVACRRERLQDHAQHAHSEALALLYGLAAVGKDAREEAEDDGSLVSFLGAGGTRVDAEVAVVADGVDDDHGPGDVAVVITGDDAEEPDAIADAEVVLPGDDPARLLADYVRTRPDAVVCMASRARGGLHRRLVGNVTEQVVHASACPVIAVGPRADLGASGRPPATILVAVGSGLPSHTVGLVATWARVFRAQVVATHVEQRDRHRDAVGHDEVVALSKRLQGLGVEARGRVVAGPRVAESLLTVAAALPQPLLLVAPVGERSDDRVPTDVTHQLLQAGRWPVLASAGRPPEGRAALFSPPARAT